MENKETKRGKPKFKKVDRFPLSLYGVFLIVLLLMSGFHTAILIYLIQSDLYKGIQAVIPILYWALVAIGLTRFTRRKIRQTYEEPLKKMAAATEAVARGDFSVYMPTIHTSDKLDYLDYMILDFNKMVEELGSIETLKSDFISNVSHEMKTPIAVIKNYSKLLEGEQLTEEQRLEYVRTIKEAADRLNHLITNILKLNKLENQQIQPQPEVYDVCEQICDCLFAVESLLEEKNLDLDAALDERIYITADKGLVEMVWNNLISNAIKFSEPGGIIRIQCRKTEDSVRIDVIDQGLGMTEETKKHIFDKFYQADTSHATEGNGLGLALACRIIELMSGRILVESEYKKGSRFTVWLPMAERVHEQE